MIIAGLISGTSADALDIALVDIDDTGDGAADPQATPALRMRVLAHREVPFEERLGLDLLRLLEPDPVPLSLLSSVDARFGQACADAVTAVVAQSGRTCDLVVAHGQTVRHDVRDGVVTSTLQVGQPAWIAEATGVPVLSDVRSRDVAAGGQGAPLASILDHLLLAGDGERTAMLNLGGIANLTVVDPDRDTIAFDSGPANALIDLLARRITGDPRAVDRDGALAAAGRPDAALLASLLAEPYYALPAPKSTGKELFHADYLDRHLSAHAGVSDLDAIATLTALTARTVADACRRHDVRRVIASGGGTRNPTLLRDLRAALGEGVPVSTTDEAFGLPEGAKEAGLMALIGWLTWHGLPSTLPSVTGAGHATVAGRLTPGANPLALPRPRTIMPTRLVIAS